MRSVSGTESVTYIDVSQISQFFCKSLSCLLGFGLLFASETGIL